MTDARPDRSDGEAPGERGERMAGSAARMGFATALSRVTGLLREQTMAFLFGAGMATDAFNVAFRIPNLLRDLFAEGALSQAFIPTFTEALTREGKPRAFALADRVIGAVIVVLGIICLAGILLAPELVHLIAGGIWSIPGKGELTVVLTRIMLPFILLIALASVAMGMLNAQRHFFLPALAPTMLNLGMIVVGTGLALAAPYLGFRPVVGLAIGVIVGGLGQLAVQIVPLWREGYHSRPRLDMSDPGVREILHLMAPATISNAATQVNVLVNTWIASWLVEGSISWLSYAFRLMQLPIGIVGVSTATVSQVDLAERLTRGESDEARAAVVRALRIIVALTIPASVALAVLSRPIVSLLYEYRRFHAADTIQTADALCFYAIGLVGFAAVKVLVGTLYALRERRPQLVASLVSVSANVVLNLALMRPLGHRGLALATSITGLLNMAMLLPPVARRLGGLAAGELLSFALRVLVASAGMGLACRGAAGLLVDWLGPAGFLSRLLVVGGASIAGVVTLAALLKLLGVHELELMAGLMRRRFSRRPS